jgi:hypothetical protein
MEKQYPIFSMELQDGELKYGLNDIALVDQPAYESMFLKFDSDAKELKFAVQNEEQRIIMGAVMIPDKLVPRIENNKPFYVYANRETIFNSAIKFARENRNNNIKLTHDTNANTGDVFIFESFVTDENRIPSVKGFESLPVGTWFITCKVLSETVWNQIKDGTFNGFSLEAMFKMNPVTVLDEYSIKKLLEAVNQ